MTLSKGMQLAAAHAVGSANFARFYRGQIVRQLDSSHYRVAMNDALAELPVYGDVKFKAGDRVWIISPDNSNELNRMFILGVSGPNGQGTSSSSADHDLLMKLLKECDGKLSKGAVVQELGSSTTNVMSQKAVTDLYNLLKDQTPKGIQGILLGFQPLTPTDEGIVAIPVATTASLGVVRSSSGQNEVSVDSTGIMAVNSVNVMRLEQDNDNWLILDGGNAAGL